MILANQQEQRSAPTRADLFGTFLRHAESSLMALFRERTVTEDQVPRLLNLVVDEAVKQFPRWISQVALICHLTAQYRNDVYGFLASMLGDSQSADDLTQETFIKVIAAVRQGDRVPPENKMRAWLFVIGTNLARDAARKRKSRRELTLDAVPKSSLTAKDGGLDAKLDVREALERTKRCCGHRAAELMELVKNGCNKHEIAERQAVSGRTVERGLRSLAAALRRFSL